MQRVLVREVQVAYRESRTSSLSGAIRISAALGASALGRMAREQEACVPAVLRRRPWNQAKKATSMEKRSSFVKLVRWLSMTMTAGAWTSYPISWSVGSDSGCWSESITIAVRAWPSGVGQRLTGDDVVRVLEGVSSQRGKPQTIRVDNGPDFISRSLDLWA